MTKPTILTLVEFYLPGFKAGGPLRTIASMVERLSDEFEFKVICTDRDTGEEQPYAGIRHGQWQDVGAAQVYYLDPEAPVRDNIWRLVSSTSHDLRYQSSFMNRMFSIAPVVLDRLHLLPNVPVVMAPRGEFAEGSIQTRRVRKRAYVEAAKLLGLYDTTIFQASSEYEEADIRRYFGAGANVSVALDLSMAEVASNVSTRARKEVGSLDVLFLSRIAHVKNLKQAIDAVAGVTGQVRLHIFGQIEQPEYWAMCLKKLEGMPSNIQFEYCGALPHERVVEVMSEHDVLLLPTLGENFGHVIQEALVAACPVLISDLTPWRELQASGAGWDLPLDGTAAYTDALQTLADMDEAAHATMRARAQELGQRASDDRAAVEQNRELFRRALAH